MSALTCAGLTVGYGSEAVLAGLDLAVAPGETLGLLGPSGSGKTTLLNAVAGFLPVWSGSVEVAGTMVSTPRVTVPPDRRSVGFVFQGYALWPHLSALDNVAYPFRRQGLSSLDARRQARDLLVGLGLGGEADRRPDQLSGGQQQRVGLARALARRPDLFLFDEPTAHLDGPLRAALAEQITEHRRRSGAAAIHSTHDAGEALAVADRVAVLREGRIVQVGTPTDIYERPVDRWVAELSGPASILDLPFEVIGPSRVAVTVGDHRLEVRGHGTGRSLLTRPEWVGLGGPLPGTVTAVFYRGSHTDHRLDTPGGSVLVREAGAPTARLGERTGWRLDRVWTVPDE